MLGSEEARRMGRRMKGRDTQRETYQIAALVGLRSEDTL